ncbi:helix-turn-helix domain-containing protein [Natronolimnohabitans innermongolicus]|uniref:Bacterio-opsin activator HTH domain-containing protein n=1 Tax=Natronolimnohabitans innermongolicus JCM 12255 TaxID=1227499 RepID=L9WU00_9EURY|nr:helix-turn-helix domain-containing protein [Natronolimnohabitans innermongolicus]ELY52935.1 Bacterio-opsin activator HTH domain-containing protein [Natronolimnohabitans innermongolicus JCM 12255]
MTGFRATVVIQDPSACPVADVSATADAPITDVARSRAATDGTVVEEFGVAAAAAGEAAGATAAELTPVQATDTETVYRFEREANAECACEVIERTGTPVTTVRADDGALELTFRTIELSAIADIVDELRERFGGVVVEELTQDHESATTDPVLVDRGLLTTRQREILETAHEMGYFDYPKGANATDVAEEVGIARSTFTEHLAAAQTKLLGELLEA